MSKKEWNQTVKEKVNIWTRKEQKAIAKQWENESAQNQAVKPGFHIDFAVQVHTKRQSNQRFYKKVHPREKAWLRNQIQKENNTENNGKYRVIFEYHLRSY